MNKNIRDHSDGRAGTIIIAIFSIVLSILPLIGIIGWAVCTTTVESKNIELNCIPHEITRFLLFVPVVFPAPYRDLVCIMYVIFSWMLLYGAWQKTTPVMLPWMCLAFICLFLNIHSLIEDILNNYNHQLHLGDVIWGMIIYCLESIFIVVVISFYMQLRKTHAIKLRRRHNTHPSDACKTNSDEITYEIATDLYDSNKI